MTSKKTSNIRTLRSKAPANTPLPAVPTPSNGDNISSQSEILRRLYFSMLRYRRMEEQAQRLLAGSSSAGAYDLAIGHEAVVAATTAELRPADTIAVSGKNFAARIVRGASLRLLLAHAHVSNGATLSDCCAERYAFGLGHLADPLNLATGLAVVHKLEKQANVAVALLDNDSSSPERSSEALKFAGAHRLPILYVTKSVGQDAVSAKSSNRFEAISFVAKGCAFPGILVDGNDAVAVWRVAQESIHRARIGSGPTLIECRIESQTEDPLAHLEHQMQKRGAWDDRWRREIAERIDAEVEEALVSAER